MFPKPISWLGMEKQNLTQQKHTFSNQKKRTTTQNKHKKTKARFSCILQLLLLLLHPFNGLFSMTTWISRHQKGKPFWILLEQETMGWQWHQLDHMQIICTSLQTDNHASTSPLKFLQAGCPSCRPTISVKTMKACPVKLSGFASWFLDCRDSLH